MNSNSLVITFHYSFNIKTIFDLNVFQSFYKDDQTEGYASQLLIANYTSKQKKYNLFYAFYPCTNLVLQNGKMFSLCFNNIKNKHYLFHNTKQIYSSKNLDIIHRKYFDKFFSNKSINLAN